MRLSDKKVIAFVSDDFEDLELWYPVLRLREEGATVHLVGEKQIMSTSGSMVCRRYLMQIFIPYKLMIMMLC